MLAEFCESLYCFPVNSPETFIPLRLSRTRTRPSTVILSVHYSFRQVWAGKCVTTVSGFVSVVDLLSSRPRRIRKDASEVGKSTKVMLNRSCVVFRQYKSVRCCCVLLTVQGSLLELSHIMFCFSVNAVYNLFQSVYLRLNK